MLPAGGRSKEEVLYKTRLAGGSRGAGRALWEQQQLASGTSSSCMTTWHGGAIGLGRKMESVMLMVTRTGSRQPCC